MKATILLVLATLLVIACSKERQTQTSPEQFLWKQEVQLQDGRIVWVDRASRIAGKRFPEGGENDFQQTLAFTNPDTAERIEWSPPKGAVPVMLAIDHGSAYYVAEAVSVGAYNDLECPNPPYLAYRNADKQWLRVPMSEIPAPATKRNLQRIVVDDQEAVADHLVTLAEYRARMHSYRYRPEERIVNRGKINSNVHGCFASVLERLGRANEITISTAVPTSATGAQ